MTRSLLPPALAAPAGTGRASFPTKRVGRASGFEKGEFSKKRTAQPFLAAPSKVPARGGRIRPVNLTNATLAIRFHDIPVYFLKRPDRLTPGAPKLLSPQTMPRGNPYVLQLFQVPVLTVSQRFPGLTRFRLVLNWWTIARPCDQPGMRVRDSAKMSASTEERSAPPCSRFPVVSPDSSRRNLASKPICFPPCVPPWAVDLIATSTA